MSYLHLEHDGKVVFIHLDDPGDKVNKLSESVIGEFNDAFDTLENDADCEAIVLISRKRDNFIAGADLEMLQKMTEPGMAGKLSREGHLVLNRIEGFAKPVIAAIHGTTLGGGLEVALACHYRIASEDRKTVFGLPEVKLGLLPGGGGTQRLPRLVGLQGALDILLTGKNVYAHKARKIGLVDRLIHRHGLKNAAKAFALEVLKRPPKRRRKKKILQRFMESNPLGRSIVFKVARKTVLRKTAGNYPAPLKILDCVRTGLNRGMKAGLETEAQGFDELVRSPQSRQLVNLFFAMTATKKNPHKQMAKPIRNLGVLGAGLMGSGIAEVSDRFTVYLKDLDMTAVRRGERMIWKTLDKQVRKRIITSFERDQRLACIHGISEYGALAGTDLVIEAVFENLELKREILKDIEDNTGDHCIFASNTSSLPIARIARDAKRPGNVIGMHYFSPVAKMPLLEIITTPQTSDWVTASAVETGLRQGKNVIVVNDGPGFYTTRVLAPLLNEAILLLEEGAAIETVDKAMLRFGFPVGPLMLLDEVGIDVGAHVGEVLGDLFGARGIEPNGKFNELLSAGFKGRKNRKGFYQYDKGKKKPVNDDIYRFFGGRARKSPPASEIQERLSLVMINEAAYCLQEEILANPLDGDIGAILGLGFPPFLGGPFRHMDAVGAGTVLDRLVALENRHGIRFKPASIIADYRDRKFYS